MTRKASQDSRSTGATKLRRAAEARLRETKADRDGLHAEVDDRALVHELQVHQIELQMQNEELQIARHEAQEALDKYYDLFDFAPVGYFLWDEQGTILEANLMGAAMLGLQRSRVPKHRFAEFVAVEDRVAFAEFLKRVLACDAKQTCEVKLLAGGTPLHALVEGIAAREKPGETTRCRAAVINLSHQKRADRLAAVNKALQIEIAARKRAEGAAQDAQAAAEHANRAKDHFLAVVSHELRTPLTPVVMGIAMLQDRPELDPAARETLAMIRRNVEMEAMLIDDLLDVARIARGRVELNRRPIELCTVIQRAVEVCRADIEAHGLRLAVDLGPGAPYWIDGDLARLQQVFWNLLRNAGKFTPHGGSIRVRCRPDGDHVVVEVSDNGIGIEPEALPRIFDAFEQAERSTTRQFGGLGLGLAISKTFVEMHGGDISAHSEGRNRGATFRVRLPLCAAPLPAEAQAAKPAPCAARSLRILLVEDHGITAKIMRVMLTDAGHTVETAGDIAAALEMAGAQPFDVMLSDLGLPDGSGHDLMRELRARGCTVPGIALSGYGHDEDIRQSHEAGFAAHLTKPASREAILDAVEAVAR